jgi:N-acetylglucosamine kinase-like BadF-type ATPase
MSLVVGVDGGQSTLRLSAGGAIADGPGFSYHDGDPVSVTLGSVRAAWTRLGHGGPVERVVLGLTGLPSTVELRDALAAGVARLMSAGEVVLCADNVTAHAGALPDGYGVALTGGTGVNCLAVDAAAAVVHRVDGWGHLYGDDGSAFAIGRAGIAAVLRAVDGRGAPTALSALAVARFGPVEGLPLRLYTSRRVVDDTARFAPDVVGAAGDGDEVAAAIVSRAGRELARTATAAVAVLPGTGPVPVAHVGRLMPEGGPLVGAYREALARQCPRAREVPAAGSALDGALRLAATPALMAAYGSHIHVYRGFS